jgi:hypothetical protein
MEEKPSRYLVVFTLISGRVGRWRDALVTHVGHETGGNNPCHQHFSTEIIIRLSDYLNRLKLDTLSEKEGSSKSDDGECSGVLGTKRHGTVAPRRATARRWVTPWSGGTRRATRAFDRVSFSLTVISKRYVKSWNIEQNLSVSQDMSTYRQ